MAITTDSRIRTYDGIELDATLCRPDGRSAGSVVLVHGITADKDENGLHRRLAHALAERGRESLRFSFRGHGESGGEQLGVTIAGEMNDLLSVLNSATLERASCSIVASSFGAVSTVALLGGMRAHRVDRLVLWYPVLDLADTFLEPHLPWGRANFGADMLAAAQVDGSLKVEDSFALPYALFAEMRSYDISSDFAALDTPTLVIHGTADGVVSFDIARRAGKTRPSASLIAVEGADHGFRRREEAELAIRETVAYLTGSA